MSSYFVVLETDAADEQNMAVRRLQLLGARRLSKSAWLIEYSVGIDTLHEILRANISAGDHLLVHPLVESRYSTNARAIQQWMSGGEPRNSPSRL